MDEGPSELPQQDPAHYPHDVLFILCNIMYIQYIIFNHTLNQPCSGKRDHVYQLLEDAIASLHVMVIQYVVSNGATIRMDPHFMDDPGFFTPSLPVP